MTLAPPIHHSRRRAAPRRSFTLVEVLAAVALLAMLTTGLTSLCHTLRATAAMLQSLPELDRARTSLADELRDDADTKARAQQFPSSFLANTMNPQADTKQRTAGPGYVWLVHSRRGVSTAILAPRAAMPRTITPSSTSLSPTPLPTAPHQGDR